MEDLDYALNYLIQENKSYSTSQVPDSIDEKEKLWRAYCNIRDAKPIEKSYKVSTLKCSVVRPAMIYYILLKNVQKK